MPKSTTAGKAVSIGLDIGKSVFQVHAVDRKGAVVAQRKLRRAELLSYFKSIKPCTVAMESCASSNHWARSLAAIGHRVKLINPRFVKPLVLSQKNDRSDAEAICNALLKPGMRFVAPKSESQQALLMLHRTRRLFTDQRTMLINALRAGLAEFGSSARGGRLGVESLLALLRNQELLEIPVLGRRALETLAAQIDAVQDRVDELEEEIFAWHRTNEQSRLLETIPGFGRLTATYFAAIVPDPAMFESGRHLAAWLGLVPRQKSTGGKTILGRITKTGDRHLRSLLFVGARNVLIAIRSGKAKASRSILSLIERKPLKVATIALVNKLARIAWAVLSKKEKFDGSRAFAALPA